MNRVTLLMAVGAVGIMLLVGGSIVFAIADEKNKEPTLGLVLCWIGAELYFLSIIVP